MVSWLSCDCSCLCIFLLVGLWRDQMVAGCDGRRSIFFADLRLIRSRSPHRMARTCAAALAGVGLPSPLPLPQADEGERRTTSGARGRKFPRPFRWEEGEGEGVVNRIS